ncbi:prepilin-type N-terminal cleavage/methylation domain-containing protein [Candidatus Saccharibacteria bacterium]|nr:prepilin-type N-terminal cleavage/methylation domain-containing protein [Candidatus Saccharibacteria bacterium]
MSKRKGFTLIEVILFLAVTAMIFAGVTLGVQNSLNQQRFNDTTQNFYEFVRSWYAKATNPQSSGDGTSNYVLVGKLIVFGQTYDLQGNSNQENKKTVYVYDALATNARNDFNGTYVPNLSITRKVDGKVLPYGVEEYHPRWGATIQNTSGGAFAGSILIFRNMATGIISTYVSDMVMEVNSEMANGKIFRVHGATQRNSFKTNEINFCVNDYDVGVTGSMPQQNIRILNNARNASEVILVETDSSENRCPR